MALFYYLTVASITETQHEQVLTNWRQSVNMALSTMQKVTA